MFVQRFLIACLVVLEAATVLALVPIFFSGYERAHAISPRVSIVGPLTHISPEQSADFLGRIGRDVAVPPTCAAPSSTDTTAVATSCTPTATPTSGGCIVITSLIADPCVAFAQEHATQHLLWLYLLIPPTTRSNP